MDRYVDEPSDASVKCGICERHFIPDTGQIHVFRKDPFDPGVVMCEEDRARFASRGLIVRDDKKLVCRCGTQDPEHLGKPCPLHEEKGAVH